MYVLIIQYVTSLAPDNTRSTPGACARDYN